MEKYTINGKMQETKLGKGEGTVFYDPETENTHILDEIALDIIDLFRKGMSIEDVVKELTKIYDEPEATIQADVQEFAENAVRKQILIPV